MRTPRNVVARDALLGLPAAVIVVILAAHNDTSTRPHSMLVPVLFALYAVGLMASRRVWPVGSWVVAVGAAACVPPSVLRAEPTLVVLAFSTYSLLAHTRRANPALVSVIAFAAAAGGTIGLDVQLGGLSVETFVLPALIVAYGVGLGAMMRVNRRTALELANRNAELIELHHIAQRKLVLEERSRIARDLHDIVAHHVSGMVLHARAARDSLRKIPDPIAATSALDTIAESGAEALGAVRGLLAILRDGNLNTAPQPGLGDLANLVELMNDRGLPTNLTIVGATRRAPTDVQLSTYRIAQEALTNAARHASATTCDVSLSWDDDALRLIVADDGVGPTDDDRLGYGIVGMRERASLVGGSVTIGPSLSGGWKVEANLPIGLASAPP
jgi:signal transduction histidine kinase